MNNDNTIDYNAQQRGPLHGHEYRLTLSTLLINKNIVTLHLYFRLYEHMYIFS